MYNNRGIDDYDLSRYCELEAMKTSWKQIDSLPDNDNIVSNINDMFEPKFIVEKIFWDDVGYMLFKVYLIGEKEGVIESKKELGIRIKVLKENERISNEVKKNCLLYDRKNEIQVRVKDKIVMYISKSK